MAKQTKLQKFAKEQAEIVKKRWKKSVDDYIIVKDKTGYKIQKDNDPYGIYGQSDNFVNYLESVLETI